MMHDVNYLGIVVRNNYGPSPDFNNIIKFFDTMYASNRLTLPLKGNSDHRVLNDGEKSGKKP